jgi:hypothetical protein
MLKVVRVLCSGAVAVLAGALLAPAGAGAATYHFVGKHSSGGLSTTKQIFGYDGSDRYVGFASLYKWDDGKTMVYVCDNLADGQPVYIDILVPDGRTLSYKAPASNVAGNAGSANYGCNQWIKGFPMTQFRLRIGSVRSGAIEAPRV